MGNQSSAPVMQNVNSQDLAKNIESLIKSNTNQRMSETIGFRRNESSTLSDLHIATIKERLMRGGFLDNAPDRNRYEDLQMGASRKKETSGTFVKKSQSNTQYEADLSVDTESIFNGLKKLLDGQNGGNQDSELLSLESDNFMGTIESILKNNNQRQQGGNIDSDLISLDNDGMQNIISGAISSKNTQQGGNNDSELESLNSENIESLKNLILDQISQQQGGNLEPSAPTAPTLPAPETNEKEADIYSSISEADLKNLRDMILSKDKTQQGGAEFSTTSSQPIDYKTLGLVGGGDDDDDDDYESDDESSDSETNDKESESGDEESDDELSDDDDDDDDSEEDEESLDDDEGETSEMARQKNDDSSSSSSASQSGSSSSSGIGSSDLRKLRKYMDSDAYIAASNSSGSNKDFKISVQDFYTTDSNTNTYKGSDTGSEYFKNLRQRDRSTR